MYAASTGRGPVILERGERTQTSRRNRLRDDLGP